MGALSMAYQFETDKGLWQLFTRKVELNGGREQTIYFFSRNQPKSGTPTDLPAGYEVKVTERTGLPVLKKA
jgi:hypothetical protein